MLSLKHRSLTEQKAFPRAAVALVLSRPCAAVALRVAHLALMSLLVPVLVGSALFVNHAVAVSVYLQAFWAGCAGARGGAGEAGLVAVCGGEQKLTGGLDTTPP